MSPSTDLTVNVDKILQIVPRKFYNAIAKFINLSFDCGFVEGRNFLMSACLLQLLWKPF
jgi:hypothetical protein